LRAAASVTLVQPLEAALGAVSIFSHLRPDEVGRIARKVTRVALDADQVHEIAATVQACRLVVVVSGCLDVVLDDVASRVHERMRPGDRYGEAMLLTGNPKALQLKALLPSEIALFDREAFTELLAEFPAVALPLATELASELRTRNDQVRQLLELVSSGRGRKQLERAIRQLKQSLVLRGVGVRRMPTGGLFRRLVVDRGSEPPFWMLVGFLVGLCGARLVVHLILKYKLERQLFALVKGADPNPVHIHHFNYGLVVVGVVGAVALSAAGRKSLRTLSLLFGLGCGLIFDEFALFWNLNPDYSQSSSLISAAIAVIALLQLTYFRRFWLALLSRTFRGLRSE
jgi:CRP-like cAMP-binding protein